MNGESAVAHHTQSPHHSSTIPASSIHSPAYSLPGAPTNPPPPPLHMADDTPRRSSLVQRARRLSAATVNTTPYSLQSSFGSHSSAVHSSAMHSSAMHSSLTSMNMIPSFGLRRTSTYDDPHAMANAGTELQRKLVDPVDEILKEQYDQAKASILIVGNERLTAQAIHGQLKQLAWQVNLVESGQEALKICTSSKVDMILVSVQLPDMEGIALLNILRNQFHLSIPVIFLSISIGTLMRQQALKSGATDVIQTPISTEYLTSIVEQVLRLGWFSEHYQKMSVLLKEEREKRITITHQKDLSIQSYKKQLGAIQATSDDVERLQKQLNESESRVQSLKETITRLTIRLSQAESGHIEWKRNVLVQLTEKEKQIDEMKQKITHAIETPLQSIVRTISDLSKISFFDRERCRMQLMDVMKSLTNTDLFTPNFQEFFEQAPMDELTKSWMVAEFSKEHPTNGELPRLPTRGEQKSDRGLDSESIETPSPPLHSANPLAVHSQLPDTPKLDLFTNIDSTTAADDPSTIDLTCKDMPQIENSTKDGKTGEEDDIVDPNALPVSVGVCMNPSASALDISRLRRKSINLDAYKSETFNIFQFTDDDLVQMVPRMFDDFGLLSEFKIKTETVFQFTRAARKRYLSNPYHTFRHAVDVLQTCYIFLQRNPVFDQVLSPLSRLALFISALGHDLEHPGVNNAFQINLITPLALLYNDRSILENHHCACTFSILQDPASNLLSELSSDQFRTLRKTIIEIILATDMSDHLRLVPPRKKKGRHDSLFANTCPLSI
eukprot:TRINITY_DN4776_c0_g2_i1.p1 TRINITY_DN4776_c0_g2~~TRINITY_DN4776_c0_g2_i1.p1  ORF type:complete len:782 (-),score=146.58 TRINITY_DN4776_c0_g2_i1:1336-3681(-)